MKVVVLLAGNKGVGKDFAGQFMVDTFNFERKAFADKVKDIISDTFDLSLDEIDSLKNQEHKMVTCIETTNGLNMRTILQRFATEAMQTAFGNTVWADVVKKEIDETDSNVVVTDFRFLHEYNALIDNNFKVVTVKIVNPHTTNDDSHISENQLKDFKFDHIVPNTKTDEFNEYLYDTIDYIVSEM